MTNKQKRKLVILFLVFLLLSQISLIIPNVQSQIDPISLVEQGKQLYNSNQFAEAIDIWQQAAAAFAHQGDRLNQGMSLSNMSLTYQQLGDWQQGNQTITQSLKIIESLEKTPEQQRVLAQTLDIQGQLQHETGQSQKALITWRNSTRIYSNIGDKDREAIAKINQAQAMEDLGLYPRACQTLIQSIGLGDDCQLANLELEQIKQELLDNPPNNIRIAKARALGSLGNILRLTGNLQKSRQVLLISLDIAQKWHSDQDESKTLINLGNTETALALRAQEIQDVQAVSFYQKQSIDNYQKAANISQVSLKIQAKINLIGLLIQSQDWTKSEELISQIKDLLKDIPISKDKIYIQINLAKNIICWQEKNPNCLRPQESSLVLLPAEAIQLLEAAIQEGEKIQDRRSQSHASGWLGRIYERRKEWQQAEQYTEQALLLAWQSQAGDIIYQWQWQLGRLYKSQGNTQAALLAYSQTLETLQSLRQDLVSVNRDVQFTFRESVEPVYREYVSLLLQPSAGHPPSTDNLQVARQAIDSLQLAELENFLRLVCLDANPQSVDEINDPSAAIIYPILLEKSWAIILKLPHKPLQHYSITIEGRSSVERILGRLAQSLNQPNSQETLPLARQVYDWLLRPIQPDLSASSIKTLIFVLDTALRNVPMAVLHDGQKYLVEEYAIALTPSLQLLDSQPLARRKPKILLAGISQAQGKFAALPYVPVEIQQIQAQIPSSLKLLDGAFTNSGLRESITSAPWPMVHLATHGQFSSQAEETFILTWDGRLDINQLNALLRSQEPRGTSAIELLVLSACETLTGDKRASLGLAGVAVRAGARSTLATLWQVNDRATAYLMEQFYASLGDGSSTKAEALQRAQMALLHNSQYSRPYYWAGYVLLGNWL